MPRPGENRSSAGHFRPYPEKKGFSLFCIQDLRATHRNMKAQLLSLQKSKTAAALLLCRRAARFNPHRLYTLGFQSNRTRGFSAAGDCQRIPRSYRSRIFRLQYSKQRSVVLSLSICSSTASIAAREASVFSTGSCFKERRQAVLLPDFQQ